MAFRTEGGACAHPRHGVPSRTPWRTRGHATTFPLCRQRGRAGTLWRHPTHAVALPRGSQTLPPCRQRGRAGTPWHPRAHATASPAGRPREGTPSGAARYHPPVSSLAVAQRMPGAYGRLAASLAVLVPGVIPADVCTRWARGILAARSEWTADFEGEQFCLGRAFYTHLETDRTGEYFADARGSDARVERHAPGLKERVRALVAEAVGGRVVQREGWCGAGVHVFPAGCPVAREGGVVHFDTEGLADEHVARRAPALSVVAMIQPPERGGGLRLWPALYDGRDHPGDAALEAGGDVTVDYRAGDVVVFDSYRCHQIQPFAGSIDRISATLHVAEIDRGLWEAWF